MVPVSVELLVGVCVWVPVTDAVTDDVSEAVTVCVLEGMILVVGLLVVVGV